MTFLPSRIACVRIPRFPIAAAWLAQDAAGPPVADAAGAPPNRTSHAADSGAADPADDRAAHWDARALALVQGTRVRAATAAAARHGVHAGMTLPQARATCATLAVLPWDEAVLARELARASAAFLTASPLVTPVPGDPGTWWIGAHGFDGLGGEGGLATLLLALARAWHPRARVAIADSCVAATAATWSTRAATAPLHVAPGGDAAYLARVPVTLLPMEAEVRETLVALGLRTAGSLAALDPRDVERRWGAAGLDAWRLARGDDPRRAALARLDDPRVITQDLATPAPTMEPILFLVRAALDRLVRPLAAEGRAAAAIAITLTTDGVHPRRTTREVRPATPMARVTPLFERCRALLDGWSLEAPVRTVEVRIAQVATATAEQGDLLAPTWRDPAGAEAALARLRAAFGTGAVVRPVPRDSHAPERAGTWEAIEAVEAVTPATAPSPADGDAAARDGATRPAARPAARLLDPPESIAVTVDRAGRPRELRWRGQCLRIVRTHGPERLSGEWWRARPFAREYWRCESDAWGQDLLCYRDAAGWWLQGWDD